MKSLGYVAAALILAQPSPSQAGTSSFEYTGICDASAAVALSSRMFAVADDESNILPIYEIGQAKQVSSLDLTDFLKSPDDKQREADIEGAARIADRIFWITSHGRNKENKERPQRWRLFATDALPGDAPSLRVFGKRAYSDLLTDLLKADQDWKFSLEEASQLPPKEKGLNIEGLASTPDNHLLIGFRSPLVPDEKADQPPRALIVPLINPEKMVGQYKDAEAVPDNEQIRASFGTPIKLRLGGLGIRSIERVGDHYLIVAGPSLDNDEIPELTFKLYRWSGVVDDDPKLLDVDFQTLAPEAMLTFDDPARLLILSDDGTKKVGTKDCKDLGDKDRKSFRSMMLDPVP